MIFNQEEIYPLTESIVEEICSYNESVTIQFSEQPDINIWKELNEKVLKRKQDVGLRFFNYSPNGGVWEDLSFFSELENLEHLIVQEPLLQDISVVENLHNLRSFELDTQKKKISLKPLENKNIIKLNLGGKFKDLEVISGFTELEDLALWSIKFDLKLLSNCNHIRKIRFFKGSYENLELLSAMRKLDYVELFSIKGLKNIDFLSNIPSLIYLNLNNLNEIINLPTFKNMSSLKVLQLEGMKLLQNFDNLINASVLEEFLFYNAKYIQPEQLKVLLNLPKLSAAFVVFTSDKKNQEFDELFSKSAINLESTESKYSYLSF